MTDIPITVSAPGASKAAAELRGVATATERAGQAASTNTAQQTRQAQALERSAAAAKKANNEMRAAITRGAAAGGAGRIGGVAGSFAGAGTMTTGQVALMSGMAVAGVAFGVLGKLIDRSSGLLLKEAEGRAKLISMQRDSEREVRKAGLGWGDQNGGTARSIIAMGGEGALAQANKMAKRGVVGADKGLLEAMGAFPASGGGLSTKALDVALAAEAASGTGLVSFEEAVKLAVEHGIDSATGILSAKTNRVVTNDDVARMTGNVNGSALGRTMNAVDRVRGLAYTKLQEKFINTGEGQAREDMARQLDPLSAKILDNFNDKMAGLEEMQKAAEAQGILAQIWQNIFNEEGSINVRVMRKIGDASAGEGVPVE
jgi:hypothetical protein